MIIGIIIAFTFFDWPWRAAILVAFLLFDFLEIYIWLRWRKRRSVSGAEGIIGARGKALTDLNPRGQVRVNGQTWTAIAPTGASAGDNVEVEATQDLTLHVRRA
jgi:membrane-bound serine protease (ClpP class)